MARCAIDRLALQRWREGILLEGKKTLPAQVEILKQTDQKTLLEVILVEGRNRQIRCVAEELGYHVLKLHRSAIGRIQLNSGNNSPLPLGHYRFLTLDELKYLKSQIN